MASNSIERLVERPGDVEKTLQLFAESNRV
jgi:hypothetical protein